MVMKEPVQASPAQMALFSRLYPLNARPVQPNSGRVVKESN
jgi:carbonic anhydrase